MFGKQGASVAPLQSMMCCTLDGSKGFVPEGCYISMGVETFSGSPQ